MTRLARQPSLALDPKPKRTKAPKEAPTLHAPPGLRWLQVDPCSLAEPKSPKTKRPRMGLAWWEGARLIACGALWEDQTAPGLSWRVRVWHNHPSLCASTFYFASDFAAIEAIIRQIPGEEEGSFPIRACVREKAIGKNSRTVGDQAECRGFIRGLANKAGCEHVVDIGTPGMWKRAAGAYYQSPFPQKSELGKRHGLALVREHFRVALGDEDTDASDAVMQGIGAMVLGLLPEDTP